MKRLLFLSVLVLALIAMLLVQVGPAAAKASKIPFTATEIYNGVDLDPGVEWYTGKDHEKIWHLRGERHGIDRGRQRRPCGRL